MTQFSSDEFQAVKDWYGEWSRIPKYLSSASLAFLAFSFTELLPASKTNLSFLHVGWLFLGLSAMASFASIITAYSAYDLWVRIHLNGHLEYINIKIPRKTTPWIREMGRISFKASFAAMLFLLLGAFFIGIHVLKSM